MELLGLLHASTVPISDLFAKGFQSYFSCGKNFEIQMILINQALMYKFAQILENEVYKCCHHQKRGRMLVLNLF